MEFSGEIAYWQRKIADVPEGARRRFAVFDALEVGRGQSVLEVGCGSGHLVHDIGVAVGDDGRAVGVDLSEDQLAAARERCADVPAAELVEGDAAALPFDEDAFDSLAAINTFEYVPDVDWALAEAQRVLKPGGRLAILSVLWDHWRYHGPDPALNEEVLDAWRAHCPHQMLPMELPAKLADRGFGSVRRELFTFLNGSFHELSYAYCAAKVVAPFAVAQGVAEERATRWIEQLHTADKEGRFGFVNVSVLTTASLR